MKKIQSRYLYISKEILDIANSIWVEDVVSIPLKRIANNQDEYDDLYSLIGEDSGFFNDITYSSLNLNIRLNSIEQFDYSISANFIEFSLEDIPDNLLEKYNNQIPVSLSDDELEDIYSTLIKLFKDLHSIEDLRMQVARAIPYDHMCGKLLFAEETTKMGYRSVWTSPDFKSCVIASIEDVDSSNGVIVAHVF